MTAGNTEESKLKGMIRVLRGLSILAAVVLSVVAPAAVLADPNGCDLSGSPARSLRNPLIPTAAYTPPGAAPIQGQPLVPGHGSTPWGVIPGDWGGPPPTPSGAADPTHGNMFPPSYSPPPKGPQNYVPGAGRRYTTGGQQQGMFEFNQNVGGQGTYEGGWGNGGQGTYEGGWGNNGQGTYEGGWGNNGQGTYEGGWGNGGMGTFEGGQGNGGMGTFEGGQGNGGAGTYEGGRGNGGAGTFEGGQGNGGAGTFESGRGNGGAGTMESGRGNGGAGTFESGRGNGGAGTTESGRGNGGSRTSESGAGNGGIVLFDFGSGSSGTQVNGDGSSSGRGVFDQGGPKADARAEQDRQFNHDIQGNKYDFQGPLPTVRTFSRYLVILGVVAATIFVALAAWSIVLGSPYGASRVVGAVGGLLLLLAGYTIWKVVQMNTFNFNSEGVWSKDRNGQQTYNNNQRGGANPGGPFAPQNPNTP